MLLAPFTLVTFLDGLLVRAGASWEMAPGLCAHTETRLRRFSQTTKRGSGNQLNALFPCVLSGCVDLLHTCSLQTIRQIRQDSSRTTSTLFRLTKFQIQPLVEKPELRYLKECRGSNSGLLIHGDHLCSFFNGCVCVCVFPACILRQNMGMCDCLYTRGLPGALPCSADYGPW